MRGNSASSRKRSEDDKRVKLGKLVVKLGMSVAIAGGGLLLNATGFDVALEGNQSESAITRMRLFDAFIPAAASGMAIWAIAAFSITEEKAHEVRQQLEARRGAV